MRFIAFLLLALIVVSCDDPKGAKQTAEALGFTHVQTHGYVFFSGCPDDDQWVTGFTAIDAQGKQVEGVVCGSFWSNHLRLF